MDTNQIDLTKFQGKQNIDELFMAPHKQINKSYETPGTNKKLYFDYNLIEYQSEIVVSKYMLN
jgi:hypothetical protein